MALRRTVDLLPEIFQTDTNKKFLAATLDQLTQEPKLKRTQGYIGRRVGPGVDPSSSYVSEPTATRRNYQLEPGVVFLKPNTSTAQDAITYPGMIDALALQNADVTRQDRLWQSDYYAFDPFCDFDKFVNYSQYYWLPGGPDSVDVSAQQVLLTDDYTVTRTSASYQFTDVPGNNPIITLARGGNYTFSVNQPGHKFWIQSAPGVNGRLPQSPNISSRDVYGVVNNGIDGGTVEFYVPQKTSQDFYYNLADAGSVDLIATTLKFSDINNVYVSNFLETYPQGIDGITSLNGRTIVFTNRIQSAEQGGWQVTSQFDPLTRTTPNEVGAWVSYDVNGEPFDNLPYETQSNIILSGTPDPLDGYPGSYDSLPFDQTTDITMQSQRYSVWQINYVYDNDGTAFMQLSSIREVPNLSKFKTLYGNEFSSTQWYKDSSGFFNEVPLLTATQDVLWYQDSTNPEIFGQIQLVDSEVATPINIDDIVGAKNYTSPNGVVFTNGLKVQFRGVANPAQFQNLEYYVEGVGTGPGLDSRVGFINGEAYFGPWHWYQGQKMTGLIHSTETYQEYVYDNIADSLANPSLGGPTTAALPVDDIAGANLGSGIKLIPVQAMITPETYTLNAQIPYDTTLYDFEPFDESLNSPLIPDYITQNRASNDRNAWSRSNRWFHIDVINYSAERNNASPIINNTQRAKRPIIEFRANLRLWNNGTDAKAPVNVIDFNQTDALSNVNGQIGYSIDGYTFINGSRIIFAADIDPSVRNRIYEVQFVDPTGTGRLIIDLVPVVNGEAQLLQTVVSLNGISQQGITHWFDGVTWQRAQEKTRINQPVLFDIYDANGRSFGDRAVYPSSTFNGCRLFGYAEGGNAIVDDILGLSLKYRTFNNVGDIVFQNYLYTDSFIYVKDNVSSEYAVSNGFARQYIDRVSFSNEIGWQTAAAQNRSRQVFQFVYQGQPLVIDVPADLDSVFPPVQLFIAGEFIDPTTYTVSVGSNNTTITLPSATPLDSKVEAQVISNQASNVSFYQVPLNLENNSINGNSTEFTLGSIRNHYDSIGQNLKDLRGDINGNNNTRDLGNIIPYGTNIIQNSAPIVLTGAFLRDQQFALFSALEFNSREYSKYKALLLDLAGKGDFINSTPTQVLDAITQEISITKNDLFPFYWSDMLPAGDTYSELAYTITPISTNTFDTTQIYNLTESNFQAVLVYLNGEILTRGYDYEVPNDTSTVVISATLSPGDVVKIREYATTAGSFVPNTPTKMGLYPSYKPRLILDTTYVQPTMVIVGHDGSVTVAFGDYRDQVLLEFETRIFNNLKIKSPIPLTFADVIPGQFRTTDYTLAETNSMLLGDFLSWVGSNKLDYTRQTYLADNPFTYNYSSSSDRLTGQPLPGAWRGIYNYFYDTITPNTTPWEMLGFYEEPSWWRDTYGQAPYTSGNLVLWRDLERGFIADPIEPRIDPRYARPGLTSVIPSGSEGELVNPLISTVGNYDATSFRKSWVFGDDGPVENTWRSSSAWPFAVMRLLALTKPAEFFSLFVDRDRYVYDNAVEQYLWDQRYRLVPGNLQPLYGNGTSKASYIDWIIDYNRQTGVDSSADLTTRLSSLDVRLCWRAAGFTDKRYLKIYTERSTPTSTNIGLLLPDESYQILLYNNVPFETLTYSSVVVQAAPGGGWSVFGYNNLTNYFEIRQSRLGGQYATVSAGGTAVRVSTDYTDNIVRVPYGYVFANQAAVCDFLFSYGKLLSDRGMIFDSVENGYIINWDQMAQEFLYWSNQGWAPGSIVNLNPASTRITATRPGAVAQSLYPSRLDSTILNQNRQTVPPTDIVIDRFDNTIRVSSLTSNSINLLSLKFTSYEHLIILDNRSIFADLIYDPITGSRQSRVRVAGWLSSDWNGTVNAPGFVLNQDNIKEWLPNRKYTKGDIVIFKNEYWSANAIIAPAAEFDYSVWLKSDYDQVQKGLLPNAANASDQLAESYSVYNANLEQEVDLFSYGLIGFRPRQYMQGLNLDDVSQVNLYQQFLGTKGTRQATNLFSLANLGKEIAEYNIYEYWAILRNVYGANANRSFVEFLLEESKLISDPSLIQVIQPQEPSEADQTVLLENIWKSSYRLPNTDIFPTTLSTPDNALPGAGYVKLDDADITVFDLDDPNALANDIDNIGVGTSIWVARVNTYQWGIYRSEKVPGNVISVEDNLNGLSIVTFTKAHGLTPGDTLIIKLFNDAVDGAYLVQSVPSIYSVLIPYTFSGFETSITGTGIGLFLQTTRVQQPADLTLLPYASQLLPGARVWVDNNGQGRWEVLEKTDQFTVDPTLAPKFPYEHNRFGAAVSQGLFNLTALVGAPGYNPSNQMLAPGGVYSYVRTDQDVYEQNSILELGATNTVNYGNAIDVGSQTWAVIGANLSNNGQGYVSTVYVRPGSNFFDQRQVLVNPDLNFDGGEFGTSVTMSSDERWMYVSAPKINRVYAYAQVQVQSQAAVYRSDDNVRSYNWSNHLAIDYLNPDQLSVVLDNQILTYPFDYTVTATDIVLTNFPVNNKELIISRRNIVQLDQKTTTNVIPSTLSSGQGALFLVNNVRGVYSVNITTAGTGYSAGDLLIIDQDDIATAAATPPAPIVVTYVSGTTTNIVVSSTTGIVPGMSVQGVGFTTQYVVSVPSPGNIILNAAPDSTPSGPLTFSHDIVIVVDEVNGVGGIIDFSWPETSVTLSGISGVRGITDQDTFNIMQYLATVTNIDSFSVRVNNVLQRPELDYDFNSDSSIIDPNLLVFNTIPPAGAVIQVNSESHYEYVNTLSVPGLNDDAEFGHSIHTTTQGSAIIIGAPNAKIGDDRVGKVYVFDRNIERFTVTDASVTQYYPVQDLVTPGYIAVTLNGVFLLNTELDINGTFTVDTTDLSNQFVIINTPLAVGDIIEVSTNQFELIESISAETPGNNYKFGDQVDQCMADCSLYIGSPNDSSEIIEAGSVEFHQNQSRIYGVTTSVIGNPTLTVGDYIRLNNIYVELVSGTTVSDLVTDINAAKISNIIASSTTDLILEADGSTRIFDVGDIYSAAESYTTVVYVNDVLQTYGADYTYNNATQQITFTVAPPQTYKITVVSGRIVVSVKNLTASVAGARLTVNPGTGTLFDDLGFNTYVLNQVITSPVPQPFAHFGGGLFIGTNSTTLIVGAPNGNTIRATTFDLDKTTFDLDSTNFADPTIQSGAVYSYDYLPATNSSITNPAQFVFGQQFVNESVNTLDQFGAAIDLTTGVLLIGAPGSDVGDSSQADFGQVLQYKNAQNLPAWAPIRYQTPAVNIDLMNSISIYDRITNQTKEYFDFFDPLQGRILGAARQNINFIGAVDPATYNNGPLNNYGSHWAQERVGQIWWDTDRVRFIDPKQDDIVYASRRWGQLFPGSEVQMYQWIVSTVPPVDYVGPGTVKSTQSYTIASSIDEQGFLTTHYYFWVTGLDSINQVAGKTLSTNTLQRYIESPKSSGIPYVIPIDASTVAIYNGLPYISALDTVLHVEYDREKNDAEVHVEYQLIPENKPDGFLNDTLYRKLLDSLTGADTAGNLVPDPFLSPSNKYGIQFRPRQSMVENRFLALQNYMTQANTVLAQYPITEMRPFNLLNSRDPEPAISSGQWNRRVVDLEELSFQDLYTVDIGYKYLVASDSSNNGLWSIYEVTTTGPTNTRILSLVRVQNYDTRLYWNTINWYRTDYNPLARVLIEVPNRANLDTLNVPNGSTAKVTANSQGLWEIYIFEDNQWIRVGLQNGTIEISAEVWNYTIGRFGYDSEVFDAQYFDQAPITETRKIIEAINQELFIDDLLIERNRLLMLMFNYIMSEEQAPDWLTKTSLIDVEHTIRNLVPYQIYRTDNQDFVLDYVNEVKPYHVQIREFSLKYNGSDIYQGSLTDFDVPAYYSTSESMFISPVLDNTGTLSTTSSVPSTDPIWQTFPWSQWYNNYLLSIESVKIISGGSGYTVPPDVVVTGDCQRTAVMTAQINSAGRVVSVTVLDPGQGYSTTAIISLQGGNGTGASAVAVMGNMQVRSLTTTIKYDRYQYISNVQPWQPYTMYDNGSLVRYADTVWMASSDDSIGVESVTFDPNQWTVVPPEDLSGVDRTMGYYVPTPNEPGLDLAQLISGVEYPGVQVAAPGFAQNTGFDNGAFLKPNFNPATSKDPLYLEGYRNVTWSTEAADPVAGQIFTPIEWVGDRWTGTQGFDSTPFDNISFGPTGAPTYDPAILDAIYESSFVDPYLGTRPTDVNIDGGAFVDTYESHAPEELVPGISYDTLDFRVFTTPGADWVGDGHGSPLAQKSYLYDSLTPTLSFNNLVTYPLAVQVYNQTTATQLDLDLDYTVNWVDYTVNIINNTATTGQIVTVIVYALGGGNQLYTNTYLGDDIGDTIVIPFTADLIDNFAIFANGVQVNDYTYQATLLLGYTEITFGTPFTSSQRITLTALGGTVADTTGFNWSLPLTQYIVSDGSLSYTLLNSMQGTNPANLVVNKNGQRARPPEDIGWIADGSSLQYFLPENGGFDLALVSDNDVTVWIDNVPQVLGVDFVLDPMLLGAPPTSRTIRFAEAPEFPKQILISVRTKAQYWVVGNTIVFQPTQGLIPVVGDILSITSWNATNRQDLITQVYQGPESRGTIVSQNYDTTNFDQGNVTGALGSFDYSSGVLIQTNNFITDRNIPDSARVIVTLNGRYLFPEVGFTVSGRVVTLSGPVITAADTVVITNLSRDVVPDSMAFRIFQDMRGLQSTYRITPGTTTTLVQELTATADVIYVDDASRLTEPNLEQGIFGLITINGERIAYRNRDTVLNTVSGLRRGTAGTGAAHHDVDTPVYDIGLDNYLDAEYQDYRVESLSLANGATTTFVAENISIVGLDSTELVEAVQVRVGGTLQQGGYTITLDSPVTIEFNTPPKNGSQVSISILQGHTWYQSTGFAPSNGIPLQTTNTYPARFLRGIA